MSIPKLFEKINIAPSSETSAKWVETVSYDQDGHIESGWQVSLWRRFFLALIIILIGLLGFGVGRLTGGQGSAMKIEYDPSLSALMNTDTPSTTQTASVSNALNAIENSTQVVGSSKGTKYHYSHCPGAKQISEANKVTFPSPDAAEASGYALAGNCRPK